MKLSKEDINSINNNSPSSEQGIYKEPYGIPTHIKEYVIYMRWQIGGVGGGSCWGNKHYSKEAVDKPKFKVLDLVIKKLYPNISFLQFREIEEIIKTNEDTSYEYYGNSTDYKIEYIILSELESLIEKLIKETE